MVISHGLDDGRIMTVSIMKEYDGIIQHHYALVSACELCLPECTDHPLMHWHGHLFTTEREMLLKLLIV